MSAWNGARGVAVCALLAPAALGGCGSNSGRDIGTRARTLASTPTHAPAPKRDKQIAENSIPTLDDFPSGWTQADSPKRLKVRCPAISAARKSASGIATSPAFTKGDNTQAVTAVYVFAREAAATRAFKAISGRATRRCYADRVSKALSRNGIKVRNVKTARLSLRPLADQHAAGRITIAVTSEGVDLDLYLDLVFVRTDRGLSLGLFIDALAPLDKQLRVELTAKQVRRLSNGLA